MIRRRRRKLETSRHPKPHTSIPPSQTQQTMMARLRKRQHRKPRAMNRHPRIRGVACGSCWQSRITSVPTLFGTRLLNWKSPWRRVIASRERKPSLVDVKAPVRDTARDRDGGRSSSGDQTRHQAPNRQNGFSRSPNVRKERRRKPEQYQGRQFPTIFIGNFSSA